MATWRAPDDETDHSRLRIAVRAIVLDPLDRVLLVTERAPVAVWVTPGGGIEPGEDVHGALRRELWEEVGLVGAEIGPRVWSRVYRYRTPPPHLDGQLEHFHLVRTEAFEPQPGVGEGPSGVGVVVGARWWTSDELVASPERFGPPSLPRLLVELLRSGPPDELVDIS